MLLPILLAQAAPRDLTPDKALAKSYLHAANPIATSNDLPILRERSLPRGDIEVRYWGGFAWGTEGLILRRTGGKWTATRLVYERKPFPDFHVIPKLGWPAFWAEAEKFGIFTLPDQENAGSKKGFHGISDGYSTLVEYQKDGTYRAYAYDNPQYQEEWPPAKPMAALDAFVRTQFPR